MKQHLDLMPLAIQRRLILGDRLAAWSLVWIVLAAVAAAAYWSNFRESQRRVVAANRRDAEYTQVVAAQDEVTQVRQQIEQLQQREALSLLLADDLPSLLIVGIVSRAARDSGSNICVQHLAFSRTTSSNDGVIDVQRTLELNGLGSDNLAVARFVASLRDSQLFDRVELKSAASQTQGDRKARSYVVHCTL